MSDILGGLKHTLYIFSHPFDGFWLMKSEKKGNLKAAFVMLFLLAVTLTYRIVGSEYYFQSEQLSKFSFLLLVSVIAIVVALFCVGNWALTTLFDGKGSISEIFIMLMYALSPIIIINIPITVLTYFFVASEATFYTLINAVFIIWAIFLLVVGTMTIHEYSLIKSIIALIFTVVAMLIIVVLAVLGINLVQQIILWVVEVIKEISFRI